ncbi:hypothetical protein [Actinokineospora sp. NBRC 105648]|uniref:hypothetical protein n=1 Tax=Actinokineospora sp. NBRC 105648 TaxID=3032206 RepID=UPI0024A221C2|nr:hypothetical protein [Actinokineospora sp. NBRC 105648]GLZ42564.1 hypothetical protein Acsp05_61880 [Actinokineospora sp. NBRC 105648]
METDRVLDPVRGLVRMAWVLVGAGLAVGAAAVVDGRGSVFGLGAEVICLDVPAGVAPTGSLPGGWPPAADPVTVTAKTAVLCTADPTTGEYLLRAFTGIPTVLVLITALVLAVGAFRAVDRVGLFTEAVAVRLTRLGWVVAVGSLLAALAETSAASGFVHSVVLEPVTSALWFDLVTVPVVAVVLGAVLIAFGRVVRTAAHPPEAFAPDEVPATT